MFYLYHLVDPDQVKRWHKNFKQKTKSYKLGRKNSSKRRTLLTFAWKYFETKSGIYLMPHVLSKR